MREVSLLVAVVECDSTYVFFVLPLLSTPIDLGRIDSRGRGGGILWFPGISLALPVLFLILLGIIGRLGILGGSRCGSGCGALRSLGVIPAMIFSRFLGLDLVRGDVSRSIPSETIQIRLPHVRTRA